MSSGRSTTYRVELTDRATLDLAAIYDFVEADQVEAAARWFNELEILILSLDHLPERGATTGEDRRLRQLLHGNKPHFYRIIYSIDQQAKNVLVLHIRHRARGAFSPSEIV